MAKFFYDEGPERFAGSPKVCIATTSYDSPDASYTYSIQKTREAMHQAGIATEYMLLSGNCHVDDARNSVVQHFLLTKCTDLVFIDADVSWQPEDLVKLCKHKADVVGGVYPFRDEGSRLKMPCVLIDNQATWGPDGLVEVDGLPTGFMRIRRHVLEALTAKAEKFWNRGDRRSEMAIIFERVSDGDVRWGGDIAFCRKWRAMGGKVHASPEIRLGHLTKTIVRDSLGAALRRVNGVTMGHVVAQIRAGVVTDDALYQEARDAYPNRFGALEDVLASCALLGREAKGPILEIGSGLSTVILAAAAPEQTVYCIEHDPLWAEFTHRMACDGGVDNIGLCLAPIKNGWYDLTDYPDLPEHFALALVDGPPRRMASRMPFFSRFAGKVDTIIADDADDRGYGDALEEWSRQAGYKATFLEGRAAILTREADVDKNGPGAEARDGARDVRHRRAGEGGNGRSALRA